MTLTELERLLPNGLHDAELIALKVDYVRGEADIDVEVDVSDPDADPPREVSRPARLRFSELEFVVIDPPCGDRQQESLMINSGEGQPRTAPVDLPDIPDGCFLS